MWRWVSLVLLFVATGCSERLVVYHQFMKPEDAASARVHTPDPSPPEEGERLVIFWSFPEDYREAPSKELSLTIRYRNGDERAVIYPLEGRGSYEIYDLRGEAYRESGGIASYKAELLADHQLIEQWRHQVWVERIVPKEMF
jgi:hypothetical protein